MTFATPALLWLLPVVALLEKIFTIAHISSARIMRAEIPPLVVIVCLPLL